MAAVSERRVLEEDFSALSLGAEIQEKPVSKEIIDRFFLADKAARAVGTIGSFFCETDSDLITFCFISKAFNSAEVKLYLFSGNSELPRLLNNRCNWLDKYCIEEKMAVARIWARVTETTLSNGRAQSAFFESTYREQASREKLVAFASHQVEASPEDIADLKWFKAYDACKRLREQFVNSKLITSWTFSCKDMLREDTINVKNMKEVLTAFSVIRSATVDPYPYKLQEGLLQAFIGHSIVQLNVCMDFNGQDFEVLGKITTLQKLTLIGTEFKSRFHFDLLGAHPNLTSLTAFGGSCVRDSDFIHLQRLPKLQCLALPQARITDKGLVLLENVRNLTDLEVTYLEGDDSDQISNKGLKHLKELKLKRLNLTGCSKGVSPEFLLHLNHPKCLVELNLTNTFPWNFEKDIKPLARLPHLVPLKSNPLHFVRRV
jgi:hypothetical protein